MGLNYLPGGLARYLDEPVPIANATCLFLRPDDFNAYLTELRDLVPAGYYRMARRLAVGKKYCVVQGYQVTVLSQIFCALNPFNYRVACSISHSLDFAMDHFKENLLRLCVIHGAASAYKFLSGPFGETSEAMRSGVVGPVFRPGYVEALAKNYDAIVNLDLVGYVRPCTYQDLMQKELLVGDHFQHAYVALCVKNYRLVEHLITVLDVRAGLLNRIARDGYARRREEMLAWLVSKGWITPREAEIVSSPKSE